MGEPSDHYPILLNYITKQVDVAVSSIWEIGIVYVTKM